MNRRSLVTGGLVVVLAIVLGGCGFFKSALETGQSNEMLQPQAIGQGEVETIDDLFAKVARRVPEFGGMFFDFADGVKVKGDRRVLSRDNSVLYIYLLDTKSQVVAAAAAAIEDILGPIYPDLIPPREIRVLQAQYSFLQLKEWFDLIGVLHSAIPEVTMTDIDDTKNRLTIGVLSLSTEVVTRIEQELARLGVPRNAVILEETGPFVEDKLDIARALDANRNGFLDDLEIMRGLDLWARQAPVPALGTVITDVQLLELLELWRSQQSLISEE